MFVCVHVVVGIAVALCLTHCNVKLGSLCVPSFMLHHSLLLMCTSQEVIAALARIIDRYHFQFRIASLQSVDALNLKSITTSVTPQGWVKVRVCVCVCAAWV